MKLYPSLIFPKYVKFQNQVQKKKHPNMCHRVFARVFPNEIPGRAGSRWRICLWLSEALLVVPAGRLMGSCHRTGRRVAPDVAHDAARG